MDLLGHHPSNSIITWQPASNSDKHSIHPAMRNIIKLATTSTSSPLHPGAWILCLMAEGGMLRGIHFRPPPPPPPPPSLERRTQSEVVRAKPGRVSNPAAQTLAWFRNREAPARKTAASAKSSLSPAHDPPWGGGGSPRVQSRVHEPSCKVAPRHLRNRMEMGD
ncbi:hypothetical protein GUJ93_ZPchr0009g356 [Zizania palustris]|uniref:Uncharacterized protein n=1 Tax=Zizania palustris TaxID=103762 RepID=A0A8J5RRV0_ZIZPA|nr:hypothetical protein GUJ93_ZPchr0009g356 [Zizania palustris]